MTEMKTRKLNLKQIKDKIRESFSSMFNRQEVRIVTRDPFKIFAPHGHSSKLLNVDCIEINYDHILLEVCNVYPSFDFAQEYFDMFDSLIDSRCYYSFFFIYRRFILGLNGRLSQDNEKRVLMHWIMIKTIFLFSSPEDAKVIASACSDVFLVLFIDSNFLSKKCIEIINSCIKNIRNFFNDA